ncbi:MAG: Asp-tRNA(Asn)/Glu-tRNA(Gln) amidotransferase subunit GatC [Deltaproteobacteria bacterium]|nr:Asp-tRNA(Asn)/Glu-tRNA(Gln) amidotransferase subunit GatC [Deltaproteobacteria bacterium]MBI2501327.1 Asp-tRNA(Asn)/Glu-tRNA(Gln) amidotransferase subunit GatC [Deltaproteobacteria bacterium]
MKISHEEVKKIAHLARLELNEADVERYTNQLSQILTYIEKLNRLDVSNIEPTAHAVAVATPFRSDENRPFQKQEEVLSRAPDREGDFFKVPKVI